ncbi:mitochondrial ribosomal protein L37-domain-containing protein [Flagelloscypha sp. PMI_526]|nr:mitochondrial ribosomal protein L37-domain-containing protein [Flagelloscypha sp. PMI_526]
MTILPLLRRQACLRLTTLRYYSTKPAPTSTSAQDTPLSSCPENTELVGLNYLKDQPEVIAKPDSEYPPWLWTLLEPTNHPEGSKKERRAKARQEIKDRNFMSTQ